MSTTSVRPRLLYIAAFAWLSVTGGRFLAPFLQHQAGYSDALVGSVLACQTAVSSLLGSAGGAWADARQVLYPNKGRAQVMLAGVALGSLAFFSHGAGLIFATIQLFQTIQWHFGLRILWACSLSLIMPVLDGMTLAHLQKTPGMDPADYGKERLFGAISWAIVNLIMGPIIDTFGFVSLYPLAMVVTVVFFLSISTYVHGQQEQEGALELVVAQQDEDSIATVDESTCKDHCTMETKVSIPSLLRILAGSVYGVTFLMCVVCLSSGMAVVESLVFLFFTFLGGSNTMCGMTVALTVLCEIPIFFLAPQLLQRMSCEALLVLAACSYIIRVVGYSLIPTGHVFLVLLLEPLHGITYACFQTSTVHFVATSRHMPKGSEASGQGLLGVFKGLGSVVGLLLGGVLEQSLGPRIMYRIFAAIASVGIVALAIGSCWESNNKFCSVKHRHVALPQSEMELSQMNRREREENKDCKSSITRETAIVEFI